MPADRKRGCVEKRLPGNRLLGRFHVRHDVFRRLLCAGGKAGQRQRRTHDFEEIAAAFVVDPLRRLPGKFAVQEILKAFDAKPARRDCASKPAPFACSSFARMDVKFKESLFSLIVLYRL